MRRSPFRPFAAGVAALAIVAGCAPATDAGPDTTAYLERLGDDTIAVEIVSRSPGRIEGEVLARSPVTRYMTYSFDLDDAGAIRRFETEHTTPAQNPSGPGRWHAIVTLNGPLGSVIRTAEGEGPDTLTFTVDGPVVPTIGRVPLPAGVLERAIAIVTRAANEAASPDGPPPEVFGALTPWGSTPSATPMTLVPRGASELELDFFGSPMVLSVDEQGRLTGLSGASTTMKVEVEPIPVPELGPLAARWSAADLEGTGLGNPSPTATVEASIDGAALAIRYGRPARRGREIWGALVPWSDVWRTGANAATHLATDRALTVGDIELAAGTYTLWSIFTPERGILIVNDRTQVWGTAYDPEGDVGRTVMTKETLDEPVERFTISIEEGPTGGTLALAWDTTRYSVPLRVR
ncbi:MAG: DUF2911 domain-containing protein [Gemmatimonadota bacterium]|nr:DUF2911 domain-containing protein [Gemmatimonadota bacterium]